MEKPGGPMNNDPLSWKIIILCLAQWWRNEIPTELKVAFWGGVFAFFVSRKFTIIDFITRVIGAVYLGYLVMIKMQAMGYTQEDTSIAISAVAVISSEIGRYLRDYLTRQVQEAYSKK